MPLSPRKRLGARPKAPAQGYIGPLPPMVWDILGSIWESTAAVQSNFAREHAAEFAFLASRGWISSLAPDGRSYSRTWRLTAEGLHALEHQDLHTP